MVDKKQTPSLPGPVSLYTPPAAAQPSEVQPGSQSPPGSLHQPIALPPWCPNRCITGRLELHARQLSRAAACLSSMRRDIRECQTKNWPCHTIEMSLQAAVLKNTSLMSVFILSGLRFSVVPHLHPG